MKQERLFENYRTEYPFLRCMGIKFLALSRVPSSWNQQFICVPSAFSLSTIKFKESPCHPTPRLRRLTQLVEQPNTVMDG
jgi:hypothetical protein